MSSVADALNILQPVRRLLIFTGAGISTESGIPDFRGEDGLWRKMDPNEFTIGRYLSDADVRIRSWRRHLDGGPWESRFVPNAAHRAIVSLHDAGRLAGVVTQNIDGLHQASGLPDDMVAELHGSTRTVHCLDCSASWPVIEVLGWVESGMVDPACPDCGGLVKTSTVLFGEALPEDHWRRAQLMLAMADGVVVVGSTLSVFPAADIPLAAARMGLPVVIVNLGPTDHDHLARAVVDGKAGTHLPDLVKGLLA